MFLLPKIKLKKRTKKKEQNENKKSMNSKFY